MKRVPLNRKYRKLDPEKLVRYVEEHPDVYQREMASEFKVSTSCIGKVLRKLKITEKKTRAYKEREAIEAADCSLIYLPPYSPDLNPIEKF